MLKQLIDFGKQLFSLTRKTQQHEEDIKLIQQELKDVRAEVNQVRLELRDMSRIMERLAMEIAKDREVAVRDRDNLILRLELALTRSDKSLPPADNGG